MPEVPCQFCGEPVDVAGKRNHEMWCDDSPAKGVPPDRHADLGVVDEAATEDVDGSEDVDLPPRQESAARSRASEPAPNECPACESRDTLPAHTARKRFREELGELPDELRTIFDAAECYCNDCWRVSGGEFDEPWSLQEAAAE